MNVNPVIISIPVFIILIVIELLYERWSGKHTYRINDAITNINLGTLDQVTGVFFKVIKIGIYTLIFEKLAVFNLGTSIVSFVVLFILYDLCYYWSHRMAHEISLFWGGHVVHHQSEDYNLSVALRQSSTSFIWSFPFYLPLAIIGFSPMQLVFVAGLNLLYQFWIHTEHINRLPGWVESIMNTPSHHRVHHARDPKYIDRNYAGVFIIWDKIFGTFTEENEKPSYGITKPLNSWNPIFANFSHYIDLYQAIKSSKKLSDSLKILFRRPGWMPDYLGGYQKPMNPKKNTLKFNLKPGIKGLSVYLFIQFSLLLSITAFFLFNQSKLNPVLEITLASWILISTLIIGLCFENRNAILIKWAEPFRLIFWILGLLYIYLYSAIVPNILILIFGFLAVLSIIAYFRIQILD
jgi:sterol desaturase/sphingolipid hydroxylase (fatty acid hydroxylase superfamily)